MTRYVAPSASKRAFSCPHCGAFADQAWYTTAAKSCAVASDEFKPKIEFEEALQEHRLRIRRESPDMPNERIEIIATSDARLDEEIGAGEVQIIGEDAYSCYEVANLFIARCHSCGKYSVWKRDLCIYPEDFGVVQPNEYLLPDIRSDYLEAASIYKKSPRAASALLRLCVQKLKDQAGYEKDTINDAIRKMVKAGLDPTIQQALDVVRVTGNNAVHAQEFSTDDNLETVETLFAIINFIAERLISEPVMVSRIFERLPEDVKENIRKRDGATAGSSES